VVEEDAAGDGQRPRVVDRTAAAASPTRAAGATRAAAAGVSGENRSAATAQAALATGRAGAGVVAGEARVRHGQIPGVGGRASVAPAAAGLPRAADRAGRSVGARVAVETVRWIRRRGASVDPKPADRDRRAGVDGQLPLAGAAVQRRYVGSRA